MDCTTTGVPPPTGTLPTRIWTLLANAVSVERARGRSRKWPRWIPRGTCREARTPRAPLLKPSIAATEDAATRHAAHGRRPGSRSGHSPYLRQAADVVRESDEEEQQHDRETDD